MNRNFDVEIKPEPPPPDVAQRIVQQQRWARARRNAKRIDLSTPIAKICETLGIDSSYVSEIRLLPDKAVVVLYRGKDGHCSGPKYVWPDSGVAVTEEVTYEIRS